MALRVVRFDDPEDFSAGAEPFLVEREAEHNLLLGLLAGIREGDERYPDPYMALVEDGAEVLAVALRTDARHQLLLSRVLDADAVDAIAGDIFAVDPQLVGVLADRATARRFCAAWEPLVGARGRRTMEQRVHVARKARAPEGVPGRMRDAEGEDVDLLVDWHLAFFGEALGEEVPPQSEVLAGVHRRRRSASAGLVVWDDGGPRSMAGFGGPTPNGVRVGPVYTPPELRGRGYATALVGALTGRLLDGGRRFCFLYTDLANPTSNAIYARVGYEPVCDVDQYRFEGQAGPTDVGPA